MRQRMLWIFKRTLASLTLGIVISGCASWTAPPKKDFSAPPFEKVFKESFETVWKAVQITMSKYPMKLSDMDSGVYETQPIRGDKAWVSPNSPPVPPGGQRHKISIKILRGRDSLGLDATQVTILKQAELQRDFFSDYEKQGSDGLEEKSLMYRIEREIQIERSLRRIRR